MWVRYNRRSFVKERWAEEKEVREVGRPGGHVT